MKIFGDDISLNEHQSVVDLVFSLEAIDAFDVEEFEFKVTKNENLLTIYPRHISGYFLPKQIILSPDDSSYQTVMTDSNLLKGHEVIMLIVNPIYDSSGIEDDIFAEYSDHENQSLVARCGTDVNGKGKKFKSIISVNDHERECRACDYYKHDDKLNYPITDKSDGVYNGGNLR